jgi:N-acylmannosamine kinase
MARVLALDVGGTQSRVALFEGGRIVWRDARPTPARQGPEAVVALLQELVAPVAAAEARMAVAIAGFVQQGRVTAHNAGLLMDWRAYPLQHRLEAALQRPVQVFNDARAAAWGEYRLGGGRGVREFCFVTVSTGVGAGLVLGGRLHLARNGLDAELGETLTAEGRTTLEDAASGTAMHQAAQRLGFADGRALCDAADAGDAEAERALRHGIRQLALKLADLRVLLGIERTAVGGGLGLRPGYLERLREEMHRLPALYRHEIIRAQLGADAGLHGVCALACDT